MAVAKDQAQPFAARQNVGDALAGNGAAQVPELTKDQELGAYPLDG